MQRVRLPRSLRGLDLATLNQRLQAGEISLDWTEVDASSVWTAQLTALLAGLNLIEHVENIGADTIPESLQRQVLAALHTREKQDAREEVTNAAGDGESPALWVPEHDIPDQNATNRITLSLLDSLGDTLTSPENAGSSGNGMASGDVTEPGRIELLDDALVNDDVTEPRRIGAAQEELAPKLILQAPSLFQMREQLQAMVLRDLLGPAGGEQEEVDEDRVRDRYLIGMLAPNHVETLPEMMDDLAVQEEEGAEEESRESDVSQKVSYFPSSMGMSFCVDCATTELLVTARWGHYQRVRSETLTNTRGNPKLVWKRTQRGGQKLLQLHEGKQEKWYPEEEEQPEVHVRAIVRRSGEHRLVSLFLVNGQEEPKRLRDAAWLFQPEISVEAPGGQPIFKQRISAQQQRMTADEKAMAMRYRRHISFAVGHGVSVHAETAPGDPTCAVRLSTRVAPTYDIPLTEAPTSSEIPALSDLVLDMQELAETAPGDLASKLQPLLTAYQAWIDEQDAHSHDPASDLTNYQPEAAATLQQCRTTLQRIRAGIETLTSTPEAATAFAFLNRAMWLQRIHTIYAQERQRGHDIQLGDVDLPQNRSWRPFQLAFILLNIPALTDLHHPDRSEDASAIADLLWFPTGGGKTEAYLGLTAYTLGIRRLQGTIAGRSGEEGVAVIMRYTLRLLTLQQFQRASSLICACEMIRRSNSATWGKTPFRLGLWVGLRSTPNKTDESAEVIKQEHHIRSSHFAGVGSPRQLTSCPWCGASIQGGKHIDVESYSQGRARTLIYCSSDYGQCPFSRKQAPGEGLPVLVVDEEIYRLLPSLLIATVDKFAQLPWKGETQMLFGQVEKKCSRHGFRSADLPDKDRHQAVGKWPLAHSIEHAPLRPPDLIIQDELHLISGPLGSLVGLYETVVDHLSTWEVHGSKVRPKVIAATATIRRADQQIRNIFMRDVNIFPPQGLDAEDNFFSRQREPSEQTPGRRYLGICANGRRLKAALIRVYVAHLSAAQVLFDTYGAVADPWMTLVGYFNSMSELGGMRRLVEDDVRSRLRKMDERGLARRKRPIVEELTSRKSSTDIPDVLSKLELSFATDKPPATGLYPIDVLLATNMISVGVDVRRLGLMVVTGQPKTTAEYIQATSRVGRVHPGLVCVVYNWSRPRDLSHYEQFEHYHATFYQQVEALSVTPFAPRALDRGLAALLTSYIRLSDPQFSKNEAAGSVGAVPQRFAEAIDVITSRATEIAQTPEAVDRVRQELLRLQQLWLRQAEKTAALAYQDRRDGKTIGLLKDPQQGQWQSFTCLNSLRDVEPTVNLVLDERGLGDAGELEEYDGEGSEVVS